MPYSCYAYVLYGIKVPRSAIVLEEAKRGCDHPLPYGHSFCSQCGAPDWVADPVYVDGCNSCEAPDKWHDFALIIRDDCALIGVAAGPVTRDGDISKITPAGALRPWSLHEAMVKFQDRERGYWLIAAGG